MGKCMVSSAGGANPSNPKPGFFQRGCYRVFDLGLGLVELIPVVGVIVTLVELHFIQISKKIFQQKKQRSAFYFSHSTHCVSPVSDIRESAIVASPQVENHPKMTPPPLSELTENPDDLGQGFARPHFRDREKFR